MVVALEYAEGIQQTLQTTLIRKQPRLQALDAIATDGSSLEVVQTGAKKRERPSTENRSRRIGGKQKPHRKPFRFNPRPCCTGDLKQPIALRYWLLVNLLNTVDNLLRNL